MIELIFQVEDTSKPLIVSWVLLLALSGAQTRFLCYSDALYLSHIVFFPTWKQLNSFHANKRFEVQPAKPRHVWICLSQTLWEFSLPLSNSNSFTKNGLKTKIITKKEKERKKQQLSLSVHDSKGSHQISRLWRPFCATSESSAWGGTSSLQPCRSKNSSAQVTSIWRCLSSTMWAKCKWAPPWCSHTKHAQAPHRSSRASSLNRQVEN